MSCSIRTRGSRIQTLRLLRVMQYSAYGISSYIDALGSKLTPIVQAAPTDAIQALQDQLSANKNVPGSTEGHLRGLGRAHV